MRIGDRVLYWKVCARLAPCWATGRAAGVNLDPFLDRFA